jgi:hypothetical protein
MVTTAIITKEDYAGLARFLTTGDETPSKKTDFWLERFSYWWDTNPCFSENTVRGWVMKDNNEIVGFLGNIPTDFMLFGKPVSVFNGTYWKVRPEYRTHSMVLFLNQIRATQVVFITTPSDEPLKLLKAMKVTLIPRGISSLISKRSFVVINPKKLFSLDLEKQYGKSMIAKLFLFAKLTFKTPVLGSMLSSATALATSSVYKTLLNKRDFDVEEVKKPGREFDKLWQNTKNQYANTNIRSAKILAWCLRNKNHPMVLHACYKNKKLVGYALYKIYRKNTFFECIDLWYDEHEPQAMKSLISYAVEYCRNNKHALLLYQHFNKEFAKKLKSAGLPEFNFVERRDYYVTNDLPKKITEKNSYFVGLQGDHDLW